jgi:hypothetical protein
MDETNKLPEDQFCTTCLTNRKGVVGLNLTKVSVMRISIPLDLSSRPFIQLPRFIRSRRPIPLLSPSLVLFPPCSEPTTIYMYSLQSRLSLYPLIINKKTWHSTTGIQLARSKFHYRHETFSSHLKSKVGVFFRFLHYRYFKLST